MRPTGKMMAATAATVATVALVAMAIVGAGCGSNDSAVEQRSRGEVLAESGWAAFASADYASAQEFFEDALIADSLYADAENGLGWVYLFLGLFSTADVHFQRAIDVDPANREAEAGHAIVSELAGDGAEALAASQRVLAAEPLFSFSRRAGVDFRDLRLVRARAYVADGQFLAAKAELDILNPSNSVNPGFPTFINDLLSEIERLGEQLYDF